MDARQVTSGSTLRADLCIVGAGAAGITIAHDVMNSGLDVIVLESGGFDPDPSTTALNEGSITGQPLDPVNPLPLDATRLRFFGGTTNHWAGFCRPLTAADFVRRDHVSMSGWPIARDVLDPYYERAAPITGIGRNQFDWRWWDEQFGAGRALVDEPEGFETVVSQVSQRRLYGQVFRSDLGAAANVRVLLWANCVNLQLSDEASHITYVDCATISGRRFQVSARAYVLATGGLEVARGLLASSTNVRPAGVGNEHDLVGRHFMEHLVVLGGAVQLGSSREASKLYDVALYPAVPDGSLGVRLQGAFVPSLELQRREAVMSLEATIAESLVAPMETVGEDWAGARESDVRALTAVGVAHRVEVSSTIRLLCEQAPNPDSRVTLTNDRDAVGMRRIALRWVHSRIDRESIVRGLGLLARAFGVHELGRVQVGIAQRRNSFVASSLRAEDLDGLDFGVGTGYHHMGTARMHADPRRGVVDPNLRVHSVANLYIAGSAVFPTSGSSPPTFTITALALRLADHLRNKVLR